VHTGERPRRDAGPFAFLVRTAAKYGDGRCQPEGEPEREREPLDVFVRDDGVQGVAVRLLSPIPQCGYYDAEIVIRSDS
jgi:hypothetical protein